jgi:uroporphyrinogen-III synthase
MANEARRVLVTRPQSGASETARRLQALGFLPLTLPLHEIRPLTVTSGAILDGAAAVSVTSANAIRHAPRGLLEKLSKLPCFAVGEATAAAARAAGFSTVIEGGGDAETLAEAIVAMRPVGPVAYLCGRVRRPSFERRLADAGIVAVPVETYDTAAIVRTAGEISDAIGRDPVDYALIYSVNAAKALAETMERTELRDFFKNTIFACISDRIADVLAGRGSGRILVAREPGEAALLSELRGNGQ